MNNRTIEENIVNAFSKIEAKQIKSILSDCRKNERRMIIVEKENNVWLPRLAMTAAAVILVLSTIFAAAVINSKDTVAATISLDVNPSIEIRIDRKEKVIDVLPLNEDARTVISDMDFKGSDLKLTVNALIGSLVKNGYINELTNSILVTVDDRNDTEASLLEEKLIEEIMDLIDSGSVLAQKVAGGNEIRQLAERYDITLGKAQLIKELADKTTLYSYEDLAGLSINELNLLSRNINDSAIQRNGDPSDKAYIGIEQAKKTALDDLGVNEADVTFKKARLDFDNNIMVYEIEFVNNNVEYEYEINALTGEIVSVDREYERKTATGQTAARPVNNAGVDDLIGEARARQIALSNAGVSENDITGYRIKRDYDDGVVKYEIDFYVGNAEYEYDINALTGEILSAEIELEDDYRPTSSSKSGVYNYSGTTYKVENGIVYEYDDGRWEPEYDKKMENGIRYEYEDGRWEIDDDDDWDDDWDDDDD